MRTYWSAIFSSAWRVKRALFALCRKIVRSGAGVGFSSKTPAKRQPGKAAEFPGLERKPISEYLSAPLEKLLTIIQREATKSLTGQEWSDVLAAFQRMSDRRKLGIKNEEEGFGLIALTQGKFAIVDAEDYGRLNQDKWYAGKCKNTYYAGRVEGGKTIKMHREIMRAPKGVLVDHINHNGLDNRKSNLRLCTNAQNCYNQQACATGTSKYKGVSWHKSRSKWSARIRCDRKLYNLGEFDNEMEAAMAYDDKAVELFGEFAYPNFPERIELKKWIKTIIWAA
ncbi:hypothetical protein ES703_12840 [subsurface metagenome]